MSLQINRYRTMPMEEAITELRFVRVSILPPIQLFPRHGWMFLSNYKWHAFGHWRLRTVGNEAEFAAVIDMALVKHSYLRAIPHEYFLELSNFNLNVMTPREMNAVMSSIPLLKLTSTVLSYFCGKPAKYNDLHLAKDLSMQIAKYLQGKFRATKSMELEEREQSDEEQQEACLADSICKSNRHLVDEASQTDQPETHEVSVQCIESPSFAAQT